MFTTTVLKMGGHFLTMILNLTGIELIQSKQISNPTKTASIRTLATEQGLVPVILD